MKMRILCTVLAAVMLLGAFSAGIPVRAESNMTVSPEGEAMIKKFEGFIGVPTWDKKQNSVGWGCAITEEQWVVTEKNPDGTITEAAAQKLLDDAMGKHSAEVNAFANQYGLTFTQNQFDALTSLCFNVGGNYLKDPSTALVQALVSGDPERIAYAITLYSISGGVTSQGHIQRRLLELQMYFYNIYDTGKNWPANVRHVLLDGNGGDNRYNPYGFTTDYPVSNILCEWRSLPTGTDGSGNPFTYEFAGWFDQPVGGTQITTLDESLPSGMILYAHWKNPITGQIDDLRPGAAADIKVKSTANATLREGPCTYYTAVRTAYINELLHITRITTGKDGYQWGLTAEGWIRLDLTSYGTAGSTPEPGTYATVTSSNGVKIRSGPGVGYSQVGSAANGASYKILEQREVTESGITRIWGKLDEGKWICLKQGDASYASIEVITDTPTAPSTPDISYAITVTAVEIKDLPTRTQYGLNGQERVPDLTGGRVKVTFSNGSSKWINMTRGMVTGFNNTNLGTNTLTVTVGGKTASFPVQIVPITVTGIAMERLPDKLRYVLDEEQLDLTGAAITVQYSPAGTESVPVTPEMVSGFDNTVPGRQTVTVTYQGFTAAFEVEVMVNNLTGIAMSTLPTKLQYLIGTETLDLTGASIRIYYSATGEATIPIMPDMVTGFDNTAEGVKQLTVTYQGFTTVFDVEIVLPTVTFLNYDGTVLSSTRYAFGAAVTPPADPTKPKDAQGEYEFIGWDREVTVCNGNATYTAQFKLSYPVGDVDKNRKVDEDDAIYLLRHVIFPDKYPLDIHPDYDRDGNVDEDDAIYLLRHVIFPDKYPLT